MSELIAFAFENETGAKELEIGLVAAQADQELRVNDAALVLRQEDGRDPSSTTPQTWWGGAVWVVSSGASFSPWFFGQNGGAYRWAGRWEI